MRPSGKGTPSKKQNVFFADEKTLEKVKAFPSASLPAGQPNPITPILSPLSSSSAPSRPREAFELLEEESPMKKLRPAEDSSKKFKINSLVKVAGEDLHRVDEELSPAAEEVDEGDWEEEGDEEEED